MAKTGLKQVAYQKIKTKIVNCEYLPTEFICEPDLIKEMNMSRTPIREAFLMLEQEGFVRILPKRGIMVRDISPREANDIYQVRLLLEPFILETYFPLLEKDKLLAFRAAFLEAQNAGQTERVCAVDDSFHAYMRSVCPNRYLTTLLNTLCAHDNRLRILSGRQKTRLENSVEEHITMIDCICDGDKDRAVQLLKEHILRSKESAMNCLIPSDDPSNVL